jgi:hypothetical protein
MNQTNEQRRRGRPELPPERRAAQRTVRMRDEQWAWCERHGGGDAAKYVRELIDADMREANERADS